MLSLCGTTSRRLVPFVLPHESCNLTRACNVPVVYATLPPPCNRLRPATGFSTFNPD